jgi:hypothetical protein
MLEQDISLDDFVVSNQTLSLDNIQTRFISGTWPDIPIGEVTQAVFDQAVKNLHTFSVVGITENFDQSLEILKEKYQWQITSYSSLNVTDKRPRKNEINLETIKAIQLRNHWDIKLYEIAKRIHRKQYLKTQILVFVKKIGRRIFTVLDRIPIIRRLLLAKNVNERVGMLLRRMF